MRQKKKNKNKILKKKKKARKTVIQFEANVTGWGLDCITPKWIDNTWIDHCSGFSWPDSWKENRLVCLDHNVDVIASMCVYMNPLCVIGSICQALPPPEMYIIIDFIFPFSSFPREYHSCNGSLFEDIKCYIFLGIICLRGVTSLW